MVVGGFFDAEDAYGTFATYKAIEKQNPGANNILVAGPWFHGGWVRGTGSSFGDIQFNQPTSTYYQENLELRLLPCRLHQKQKECGVATYKSVNCEGEKLVPAKF